MPRLTWGRFVLILVGCLVCLQLVHISLMSKLDDRKKKTVATLSPEVKERFGQLAINIKANLQGDVLMDSFGQYRIINDVFTDAPERRKTTKSGVSLVTHCTEDHMYNILELRKSWVGPISVAVFVSLTDIGNAVFNLLSMCSCFSGELKNISVHFVYHLSEHVKIRNLKLPSKNFSHIQCHSFGLLQSPPANRQNYARERLKYPNNLLRNTALRNSFTSYNLPIDIDMLPSHKLNEKFLEFISNQDTTRTAYVIPAFEILQNITTVPKSKPELVKLWSAKQIQPFYKDLCWKCQKYTDYATWVKLKDDETAFRVAYDVEWKDPWEPFFIADNGMPLYDERFKQYGFNRISQVCELHIAGYQFKVLDGAFLLHRGFKVHTAFHDTKDTEQEENRILFRQFKDELKTKYPESERRCY